MGLSKRQAVPPDWLRTGISLFDNGAERTIVHSASLGGRELERTAGSALKVLPLEDVRPRFRFRYIRVHPHCGHTKTVQ